MPVLDANGEVIAGIKPVLGVKLGASLSLKVKPGGATIETPDSIMNFEGPGEWIILPMELWEKMKAALLAADAEHFPAPMPPERQPRRPNRQERRAAAKRRAN
jgi:hypothetical protein